MAAAPPDPDKAQLTAPDSNPTLDSGLIVPVSVALCPSGFVTVTFATPAAWGGVTAVIVEGLEKFTLVAAIPSKVTLAPEIKLLPLRVTEVPPAVPPDCGLIELKVGAGFEVTR